mmetsp:Transcript_66081/g.181141  ORF Transcript_66081/g.181141 Transcript_66081/m.181141 type:complete len:111 (+) Transcript_66081:377-709(+)|eukprot:4065928-Prymnesium_polylepis.1
MFCIFSALGYNHSLFVDLIITTLVGLRASAAAAGATGAAPTLTINPLGVDRRYFALDNLRYHGHDLAIAYDRDGTGRYAHAGCKTGLCVWVDGKLVTQRLDLGVLEVVGV